MFSLTQLPDEVLLVIGNATVANRIGDLVATARTCKKLYGIFIDTAYRAVLESDSKQVLRCWWLPELTTYSVLPPLPVVLWAAERNRVDTLALLWRAQCRAHADLPDCDSASYVATTNILTSAFWYYLPQECQHGLDHIVCRRQPMYGKIEGGRLLSGWCTALHTAARTGSTDAIRALVQYGAHVDATARHVCICRSRHMEVIGGTRAKLDPDDAPVTTPLHVALANGQDEAARLLVELGADWSGEVIHHPRGVHIPSPGQGETFWDHPHDRATHLSVPEQIAEIDYEYSDWEADAGVAALIDVADNHDTATSQPTLAGRKWVDNGWGKLKRTSLQSSMGQSHTASGLRIAAANAMLPFLKWLKERGSLFDHGEFHCLVEGQINWLGAFHYAVHAKASDYEGTESEPKPKSNTKEGPDKREESEEDVARAKELVDCLLALGFPLDTAFTFDLTTYAMKWGNHVMAEILYNEVDSKCRKALEDAMPSLSGNGH